MDDSNGESSSSYGFKPSYVLIAIDTHESMFVQDDKGETLFSIALKACLSVADSLLLIKNSKKYCQFAVAFAEEDSKASFIGLKTNVIDSIKILKQKTKMPHDELKATYMRKGIFDLASFLSFCKKELLSIGSSIYHRTIVYITNNPDPICGDSEKKIVAINEARALKANSITFQIATTMRNFKYDVFYNEFLSVINNEVVDEVREGRKSIFEKLSSIIFTRFTQTKLNLYLTRKDKTRYIPVVKRDLIKKQKLLNNARANRDGKLIKKSVNCSNVRSNDYFLKTHSDIVFSLEDQTEVRKSEFSIGLTLLYVSKRLTEAGLIVRKSDMIEFNDSSRENADVCRNIFSKFWQYCHDKERVLVCASKMSHNDHVRFVELVPKFAFNRKVFLMVYIPYQSERMYLPQQEEEAVVGLKGKRRQVIKDLVNRLTFDYNPRSFTNPCYAKKQAYVKSKLLVEPIEEVYDATLSADDVNEKVKDVIDEFKKSFNLDIKTNPKKRKMPAGGSRSKKK